MGLWQISGKIVFISFYWKSSLRTLRFFTKTLLARNFHGRERGISCFSVDVFLSHFTANFIWELFDVSKKIPAAINLYGWGRGVSRFSGKTFLSHITGNFFWETFVPYVFPSKVFCLTIPKILIGNSSCFQKISVMGGNEWTRRAASQISVKFDFASFYRKISFGTLRCLREILAAKNFLWMPRGDTTFFRRYFFVSHYRKLFLAFLRCLKIFLAAKSLYGWEKGI